MSRMSSPTKNPCLGGIPISREGGNLILDSMIDKKPEGLDYLEMKPNEIYLSSCFFLIN